MMYQKQLYPFLILMTFPIVCYGQGQENAMETFVYLILFFLFSLTILSIYLCKKFYKNPKGAGRKMAILISIIIGFFALLIILTATWDLEKQKMEGYQDDFTTYQLVIGYLLLIPNLLVILVAPFIEEIRGKTFKNIAKN